MKTNKNKSLIKLLNSKKLLMGELGVLVIALGLLASSFFLSNSPVKSSQNPEKSRTVIKGLITKARAETIVSASPSLTPTPKPSASAVDYPQTYGASVRVPILYYHYIGNNPNPADTARDSLSIVPDLFEKQMDYLAQNRYNPISLDTLYAALKGGQLPPKPVVLTFDDGYIDFYVNAFPILQAHHFHATSFIPTSLIGTGYYMSWNQIKEIQASGLISFEAHSLTHPDLTSVSPTEAKNQIFESKQILESEVGVPVNFFAYPYGTSNSLDWEYVKEAGYFGAVGTWYGKVESIGDQFDWPRVRMGGNVSMSTFASDVQ